MVVVNCKRLPREEYSKDYDEFLVRFPNTANVAEVTQIVQNIQNLRVRLRWMITAAKQLAKDHATEDVRHALLGPAEEAERYMSLERVLDQKIETTEEEVRQHVETLKGGCMIAFPAECSGKDCLQRLAALIDADDTPELPRAKAHRILSIIDDNATTEDILLGNATMWWAGKPLQREHDLAKYSGKNDKTKLVVKLAKEGASAPPRENPIDAKTQSEMMAYWYRKQEEHKKLVEDDDISFGNSKWADPNALKGQLSGVSTVKLR